MILVGLLLFSRLVMVWFGFFVCLESFGYYLLKTDTMAAFVLTRVLCKFKSIQAPENFSFVVSLLVFAIL